MIWIILSGLIAILYSIVILIAGYGWKKVPRYVASQTSNPTLVSVVVAFRNEEKNLPALLNSFSHQSYQQIEFILVNDHSSDSSYRIYSQYASAACRYIESVGFGKKNALKEGIEAAKGELIICTDADCLPLLSWVETIHAFWQEKQSDFIICPVKLTYGQSVFQQLQSLEFTSLNASGIGFAGAGMPIMCNGANLAFTKKQWERSKNDLSPKKVSGDDMFFLLSAKRKGAKIDVLKSGEAIIETPVQKSLRLFFNQRKRWASKNTSYTDWQVNLVAFVVFAESLAIFICAGLSIFLSKSFLLPLGILFFSKSIVDTAFLTRVAPFYKQQYLLRHIPLLSVLYPFYIVFSAIGGLMGSFEWKGRKFNS